MDKESYCFGETKKIITSDNLSKYYELDVSQRVIDDLTYMVFQDTENKGVKVVL